MTAGTGSAAAPAIRCDRAWEETLDLTDHEVRPASEVSSQAYTVTLLGGFQCDSDDGHVQLSVGTQRLIAFLAMFGSPQARTFVAGSLWPEFGDRDACAALRKQLWRVVSFSPGLIEADRVSIRLGSRVTVDLLGARADLNQLLTAPNHELTGADLDTVLRSDYISRDLLPGWYEDWVIVDQERWRHLRVHALEKASELARERGRWSTAVDMALAAAAVDPFRESAARLLVEALAAEGNPLAAVRSFNSFRDRVSKELGVEISSELRAWMEALIARYSVETQRLIAG